MHSFELPSKVGIELKEMTGAEEELLTNQRLIRNGEAINKVLHNCIVKLGDNDKPPLSDVMGLLSGDRLFALVRLRQVSLGNEVELELACHNTTCRTKNFVTVNLDDLKVTPYGDKREFSFKLPGSKKTVRFCLLDGHKEKRLAALKEPNITSAMLIRIIDIDGKAPSKKALAEMSMRDRSALRKEMSRVDAGIDTTVEVECESTSTAATQKALGELSSLGVKDLRAIENASESFTNKWSGGNKSDFIGATYDVKSALSNLSDEAVGVFTSMAALTGKATKATTQAASGGFPSLRVNKRNIR